MSIPGYERKNRPRWVNVRGGVLVFAVYFGALRRTDTGEWSADGSSCQTGENHQASLLVACHANMARPHKAAVTFLVERDTEIQEVRELIMPKFYQDSVVVSCLESHEGEKKKGGRCVRQEQEGGERQCWQL